MFTGWTLSIILEKADHFSEKCLMKQSIGSYPGLI